MEARTPAARTARMQLIGAAAQFLATQTENTMEEPLVVPVGDEVELELRAPGPVGQRRKGKDDERMAPFAFTAFDLDVLKAIVGAGRLQRKQIASKLGYSDEDGRGKPSSTFATLFGRLGEVGAVVKDSEGYFIVPDELVQLLPVLRKLAAARAAADRDDG